MGKFIELAAGDGHKFGAYEAMPAGKARGGLVVIQEIFGVNDHIRWVADGYADDGYHVLAPAVFDRAERNVELGYDQDGVMRGRTLRQAISTDDMLLDIAATLAALEGAGKAGIVGYCMGGSLAWLSAARVPGFSAAIGYYGGNIAANLGEKPLCPVMLHFGELDASIPLADAEKVKAALEPKGISVFIYPGAGHAFNRYGNKAWHETSATLARHRTLNFLHENVG
jgi:carboxymethylenebutenolidase